MKKRIEEIVEILQNLQNEIEGFYHEKSEELDTLEEGTEEFFDVSDDKDILLDIYGFLNDAIKHCEYLCRW